MYKGITIHYKTTKFVLPYNLGSDLVPYLGYPSRQ